MYCDGDIWAYRIGFSVQHEPHQMPQPWFTVTWAVDETIDKVQRKFPNAKVYICLTDPVRNYRTKVAKTRPYKGGRKSAKPFYWMKIRQYMRDLPFTIVSDNEEADDLMSKALMKGKHIAIVTEDKDLKNTPGVHWNDKTGIEMDITPAQCYRNFYMQMLTGDQIDNIPGCPGYATINATKLLKGLKTPEEFECAIGMAYATSKKVDDPEAMMIEMGRLLWMRRQDGEMWDLRANGFKTLEVQGG